MIVTDGRGSLRSSITSIWGPKALENILDLNLELEVGIDRSMAKREGVSSGYVPSSFEALSSRLTDQIAECQSDRPDLDGGVGTRKIKSRSTVLLYQWPSRRLAGRGQGCE